MSFAEQAVFIPGPIYNILVNNISYRAARNCEYARESPCRCRCGGKLHGAKRADPRFLPANDPHSVVRACKKCDGEGLIHCYVGTPGEFTLKCGYCHGTGYILPKNLPVIEDDTTLQSGTKVKINRLIRATRPFRGVSGSGRPPKIGDSAIIHAVAPTADGKRIYVVNLHNQYGLLVWEADFVIDEFAPGY